MSEKSPQSSTPDNRTIVNDPLDVVGRLIEEKTTRGWVDVDSQESIDSFQEYLSSRPNGRSTTYTTFEVARDQDPLQTGLLVGDTFKNEAGESFTIKDTREIGNQKVYRIVKEMTGSDGKAKKAVFELPEEGTRAYLRESAALLYIDDNGHVSTETSTDGANTSESSYGESTAEISEKQANVEGAKTDVKAKESKNSDNHSADPAVSETNSSSESHESSQTTPSPDDDPSTPPSGPNRRGRADSWGNDLGAAAASYRAFQARGERAPSMGLTQNREEVEAAIRIQRERDHARQSREAAGESSRENHSETEEQANRVEQATQDAVAAAVNTTERTVTPPQAHVSSETLRQSTVATIARREATPRRVWNKLKGIGRKIKSLFARRRNSVVETEDVNSYEQLERDEQAILQSRARYLQGGSTTPRRASVPTASEARPVDVSTLSPEELTERMRQEIANLRQEAGATSSPIDRSPTTAARPMDRVVSQLDKINAERLAQEAERADDRAKRRARRGGRSRTEEARILREKVQNSTSRDTANENSAEERRAA